MTTSVATSEASTTTELVATQRLSALDRLRGLAVLLMVVDHLALFLDVPELRHTVGRIAMPLFFILGGHLVRRLSWRLAVVPVVGLAVGAVAPWTGAGHLLVWFALGALCVLLTRFSSGLRLALLAWVLTAGANGALLTEPGAYAPGGLLALMLLGSLVQRHQLVALGDRLPRALALPGRFPLTVYAGQAVLLTLTFA